MTPGAVGADGGALPVARVAADLRALGVGDGDVLLVHASLRRLGPVEGGAAGVVAALEAAVGPDGTLVVVLGARGDPGGVLEHGVPERGTQDRAGEPEAAPPEAGEPEAGAPEAGAPEAGAADRPDVYRAGPQHRPEQHRPGGRRAAPPAHAPVFDAARTPADPDVGVLPEVFRTLPGTLVSDHPDGRFGARGRLASALLADQPWDDYYGPGSPLARLVDAGGRVLRLGADPDTVTLLHLAEYLADVPRKRRVVRHHRVRDTAGRPVVRAVSCLDDEHGIVDRPGEDYFATVLHAYLATGRGARGAVGAARSELLDAADLLAFGVTWMEEHLGAGG